jgi:hypothetical protein
MTHFRRLTAAIATAVALTACAGAGEIVDGIPGVGSEPPGTSMPTDPGATSGPSDVPTGPDGSPLATEPGQQASGVPEPTATGQTPASAAVDDGGRVGANGPAMLRGERPRLVIEVDVQQGVTFDQAALDHLVDEVARHVDKPEGIVFAGSNAFASDRTEWTASDLRDVAAANRSTASTADQVSVHILYVRGGFHRDGEQTAAIGVAYTASNVAIFPQRWAGLGALLGSDRAIERAVLVHELGHLFGLVNLTYESEIDHEDPDHPGHSSSTQSVMYHAIESTLIGQVFSGPPPDRFDQADAADLAGLKSGRY